MSNARYYPDHAACVIPRCPMGRAKDSVYCAVHLTLREPLADVQHDIWSHWMRYLFTTGTAQDDGSYTIPAERVQRWTRQMYLEYANLTEAEKESDREQADKVLQAL